MGSRTIAQRGLHVVGVHKPGFAFERAPRQRARGSEASRAFATRSPSTTTSPTWGAYGNQYWPAEYLIDRSGRLRFHQFGEGSYRAKGDPRAAGRAGEARGRRRSPSRHADGLTTPDLPGLRAARPAREGPLAPTWRGRTGARTARYPVGALAFAGGWTVEARSAIVAGRGAALRPQIQARRRLSRAGGAAARACSSTGRNYRTVSVAPPGSIRCRPVPAYGDGLRARLLAGLSPATRSRSARTDTAPATTRRPRTRGRRRSSGHPAPEPPCWPPLRPDAR